MRRYKKKKPQSTKLQLIDKITLVLNSILVLALLLGNLSPSIDPRDFTYVAVFGFAILILFGINILFIIYWVIRKRYLISLISVIPAFISLFNLSYFIGFNTQSDPKPVKQPSEIRLMQYNVAKFKGVGIWEKSPIVEPICEIITNVKPDILANEEFSTTGNDNVDSIKKAMNASYVFFKKFGSTATTSTGNAIFSKFPIIDTGVIDAPDMMKLSAIFADIKIDNKIIRVYCIHLNSVNIDHRVKTGYLNNSSSSVENSYFIIGKLEGAFILRSYQQAKIKRSLENCPYPYIVMGDFNDTPNSFVVNELGSDLKSAFKEKGSGFVTTYYSKYPLQIDHILTSQNFDVLSYKAIDKEVSDHKPIISDIKLN